MVDQTRIEVMKDELRRQRLTGVPVGAHHIKWAIEMLEWSAHATQLSEESLARHELYTLGDCIRNGKPRS